MREQERVRDPRVPRVPVRDLHRHRRDRTDSGFHNHSPRLLPRNVPTREFLTREVRETEDRSKVFGHDPDR